MKRAVLTILVALALSVLIMAGCKEKPQQPAPPTPSPQAAKPAPTPVAVKPAPTAPAARPAPDFTLTGFDGNQVTLGHNKGKILVLEWFNDECPFVLYHYEKVTTMVELANKYKDKGVVWLAVNSTNHTTPERNQAFAAKHNLPYPILDDRPGTVGKAYGATNTPHIFVIDKSGNIVYEGAIDNAPLGKAPPEGLVNYVDKALTELLANQPVSMAKTKPYGCNVKYAN